MKRIIATLVSITLIMSQFVLPVSAATIISNVGVNVMAPAAAKYPNYDSRLDDNSYILDDEEHEYKQKGITWYKDDKPILPDEAFEIGHVYTVKIELLIANTGDSFSTKPPVSASINGKEAYISFVSAGYLVIEYTFEALKGYTATLKSGEGTGTMEPIENVAGLFTLPECTFTAPIGKKFKAWSVGGTTGEFEPGEKAPIYSDITVIALWETKSGKQQVYDVVATSEDIDSIPVLYGRQFIPKFTMIQGAPAFVNATTSNLRWQKKVGDNWENSYDSRFSPGEWRVSVAVRIDRDGAKTHELGNPTTLTVNDIQWTPENGTGKPDVYDEYSQIFFVSPIYVIEDDPNVNPPVPVENINLRLEGYETGTPVGNAQVVSEDNISIINYAFGEVIDENNDGIPDNLVEATGNFSDKKTYVVMVEFAAMDGYDISGILYENIFMEKAKTEVMEIYSEDEDTISGIYILETPAVHEHSMLKIVSPATTKEDGKIQHFCEFCEEFSIESIAKIKDVKISKTSYVYDGKVKKPEVTVTDTKDKKLVEGKDYKVIYSDGRKNVGEYIVTIKFINNYSGKVSKTFIIAPKGTKIKSISKGKKKITVKWKKQTKQTNGYQIQYSTSKKFKGAKMKTIKKNKTSKTVLKGLKTKKKYYVRIRTFKTVGKKKYYSSWSSKKKVKM